MRWGDEHFVKVYIRDTADWLALPYDARCLMLQLLRKVDRAGVLNLGKHGRRAVSIVVGAPELWESRIAPSLAALEEDGCVRVDGDKLVIPNFLEAQEARQTDAARKRAQRERDRDAAGGPTPPTCAEKLEALRTGAARASTPEHVTRGHDPSHGVTLRREETRLEETKGSAASPPDGGGPFPQERLGQVLHLALASPEEPPQRPATRRKATKRGEPPDPRHAPLLRALSERYRELSGVVYGFRGGQDARAVADLLALAGQDPDTPPEEAAAEVVRRWAVGLQWVWTNGQRPVQSFTALVRYWNECASEVTAPPSKPRGDRDPLTGVAYP